jgi:purine-nucleoside phosphorylase
MNKSAEFIKSKISLSPDIAIVLGSGLSDLADALTESVEISYNDIPGFLKTSVTGHRGKLYIGNLNGKPVYMLAGRFHYYEGHTGKEITSYIPILKALGVSTLILTNAAGGINPDFIPGDLMVIDDHINYANVNPMIGPNDESLGPRFFDMSEAYSKRLRGIIHDAAASCGILLKSGIYIMYSGPSFETPAEIRMFGMMGADAVGMSTVPEVIAANHCGIEVAGISCITNKAAGLSDTKLSHQEVMETGKKVNEKFKALIMHIMEML